MERPTPLPVLKLVMSVIKVINLANMAKKFSINVVITLYFVRRRDLHYFELLFLHHGNLKNKTNIILYHVVISFSVTSICRFSYRKEKR